MIVRKVVRARIGAVFATPEATIVSMPKPSAPAARIAASAAAPTSRSVTPGRAAPAAASRPRRAIR